jgi:hypothetical protein
MAQKVNPISLRLGHNRTQDAHWFSMYNYGKCVGQSIVLRKHFKTILKQAKLVHARTALLKTEQTWKVVPVFGQDDPTKTYSNANQSPKVNNKLSLAQKANPLGSTLFQAQKSTLGIALTYTLGAWLSNHNSKSQINNFVSQGLAKANEIKSSNMFQSSVDAWRSVSSSNLEVRPLRLLRRWDSASLVANAVGVSIEKRLSLKSIFTQLIQEAINQKNVRGVRILVSGRINGAEIANSESRQWGAVPLHGFDHKIDYATEDVYTSYGIIGVKVWICYDV